MRFLRSVLAAPFPAAGSTISVAPPPRPSIAAAAPGAAQPLLRLTRPDDLDSPFCDVNFGPLCTRLSVENLLRLFGAMLAESRIVFLSSKLRPVNMSPPPCLARFFPSFQYLLERASGVWSAHIWC